MKTYNAKQLAAELNVGVNLITALRKQGALVGIKHGKGYLFTDKEVEQFLEEFIGYDISNEQAIAESIRQIERSKQWQTK